MLSGFQSRNYNWNDSCVYKLKWINTNIDWWIQEFCLMNTKNCSQFLLQILRWLLKNPICIVYKQFYNHTRYSNNILSHHSFANMVINIRVYFSSFLCTHKTNAGLACLYDSRVSAHLANWRRRKNAISLLNLFFWNIAHLWID